MAAVSPESLPRLEVAAPVRVERVGVRHHLYVAQDGYIGGISQPDRIRTRSLRVRTSQNSEVPLASEAVPVPIYDPGAGLVRMPSRCPSPERLPECHSYFPKRMTRLDMTVIVCPATDDRVEQPNQILLLQGSIRANLTPHLLQEGVHVLLGWSDQELVAISAQILSQEVEALFDMRDAGFLR